MLVKFLKTVSRWWWNKNFLRKNRDLMKHDDNLQKYRLVLGVGRSGTTWLSCVLSETPTPIRFFMEPFYPLRPRVSFSVSGDQTAIEYTPRLQDQHPLSNIFRSLLTPQHDWHSMGLSGNLIRNDNDWQVCIIKEVHSLLAAEAMLKFLKCPTVFLLRDPLYIIDSLFARDGLKTTYLCNESKYVNNPSFLKRFSPDPTKDISMILKESVSNDKKRERIIIDKVLTVSLIQSMFRVLSSEFQYAQIIEYESLCQSPELYFRSIASFLSLDWSESIEQYLLKTLRSALHQRKNDYPIFLDTINQIGRPFKFLSKEEVLLCRRVLNDYSFDLSSKPTILTKIYENTSIPKKEPYQNS